MAEFDEEVKLAMEDMPKLDGALKNCASVLTATSLTRSETDPGVSRSQLEWISCMKIFYKAVNLQTFKESPQWGVEHPQGEDQSALDRVDQIRRYKVIKSLCDKVAASDAKPGKYLGKKFFAWADGTFEEVKQRAYSLANLSDSDINKTEDKCALVEFCECMEQSLKEDDKEYADLIWAVDFQKALQKRQADRAQRVLEQKEREAAAQREIADVVNANADVSDSEKGGRVEELPS